MTLVEDSLVDPLQGFRSRFVLPEGVIYLDGNSLGALPAATGPRLAEFVATEWGRDLVGSWNAHGWIEAPQRLGGKIAGLIGADPGEVICADSTSVNLFKLLAAGCQSLPSRSKILTEPGNFPTDLYIAQGVAQFLPGRTVQTVAADALIGAIDEDTAVVLLTHVHYKTGRKLDMAGITAAAHAKGALVLWDLSHSVGAVPLDLNACNVDLAVGCGYKYLNGGPGAPAFLYVARYLQDQLNSPLSGWMGHGDPFGFVDDYHPAAGVGRFLCGTPSILAMAALEVGVDLMLEADVALLAEKAEALTEAFIAGMDKLCPDMELITPRRWSERGSHVAYAHADAWAVSQALIRRGVVGDFRAPDAIRFGFAPLYISLSDVGRAVEIIAEVLDSKAWDAPEFRSRNRVT
ncbi:MAG: kynureninase [Sphingobium sp.]